MQSAKEKYLEMSFELFPVKEYEQLVEKSGEADEKELLSRKAELLLPYDLKIVCAMLNQGYSLRDTTDALNEHSMFAKRLPEAMPNAQRRYADEVMGRVNEMRENEIGRDHELAEEFYLLRVGGKNLNIAQEGDTVLSMLMEGFSPETVEQVQQSHGTEREYAHALVLTCSRVAQIYKEIRAVDSVSEIRTAKDAYRTFAGKYMREHNLSKLDRKGDRDIVRRMFAQGWKEEFIRNALRFSPVAAEPWRDKGQYVDAVCSYVLKKLNMKKSADNRYAITASMYEEKINRLNQSFLKKNTAGVNANREYYDGIVARELLEEHQLCADIERAIAEKSPMAMAKKKRVSAAPYASLVVKAAYAVLQAEYALLELPAKQIPHGNSYAALKKLGITADDLYKDAILRRVHDYPSTAGMLTASFVDRDAVENLLFRYPDMERRELEDALHFNSPRALMPGIGLDYPMRVMDEVNERLEAFAEQQNKQREFRKEMAASLQSEKDAFTAGGPTWNLALCVGLAAVRMLQAGYTPMDVLPALVQPPDILEEEAGKIVEGAETVVSRMAHIQQYTPLSDKEKENIGDPLELAKDEYRRLYQTMQADRDRLISELDVEIVRNMILSGQHEKSNVIEVVRQTSPVAAEPGRGADYAEYVVKQAEIAIEKEQERLKYYRPMPRNEHEEDAEKEYEYHLRNMRSAFFLPHVPIMDTRIAEAMLAQGFQAAAISAAMQRLSPCANNDEQYGNSIMRSFGAKAKGFSRSTELPARVRTLG
ncbi:MAG: hypothetical protein J6N99_05390 [Schwartzia sp.]|nr:hypothetical protein [Schwartzia sp. (in: firmicutes)]